MGRLLYNTTRYCAKCGRKTPHRVEKAGKSNQIYCIYHPNDKGFTTNK